jgi:Uncharacterized conserved protein
MDHPEFLGLPSDRVGGDFSAGAATWLGCAGRTSNFLAHERETRNVHDLAEAVTQLANKQYGALIAIERDTSIRVYEETGVIIDGEFSVELILTIFHPKAACMTAE